MWLSLLVSGDVIKDSLSKRTVYSCKVFSLRVKSYSVLCVQLKRVIPKFFYILLAGNVKVI